MKRLFVLLAVCALLVTAGCKSSPADERAAIRTALESYLSQRGNLNMTGMDMDIQVTRMDAQTADVNVTFRAKQGEGSMQMAYQLEKQGNVWVVKGSKAPMGGAHPAVGEGAAAPAPGQLPPAHPPMTAPQPAPPKKP